MAALAGAIREAAHAPDISPAQRRSPLDSRTGVPAPRAVQAALASTLPIVAIGTAEASVVLLDTRDMQILQELDLGCGHSVSVSGIHFLSDSELVVVDARGNVTFFASSATRLLAVRPA